MQGEIQSYGDHVVERFDMAKDIHFGTRVTSARWDESSERWHVATDSGDRYQVRYLIMATDPLSPTFAPFRIARVPAETRHRCATEH